MEKRPFIIDCDTGTDDAVFRLDAELPLRTSSRKDTP